MQKKEKRILIVVAIVIVLSLTVIVISEVLQSEKESNTNNVPLTTIEIEVEKICNEYILDGYKVILGENSTYHIEPIDNPNKCIFFGDFTVISVFDAVDMKIVTKKELKKMGFSSDQMSSNQIFILNMPYQAHQFNQTVEYVMNDLEINGEFNFVLYFDGNEKPQSLQKIGEVLPLLNTTNYCF